MPCNKVSHLRRPISLAVELQDVVGCLQADEHLPHRRSPENRGEARPHLGQGRLLHLDRPELAVDLGRVRLAECSP